MEKTPWGSEPMSQSEQFLHELEQNLNNLKRVFGHSEDLIINQFQLGYESNVAVAIVFIDGLVDQQLLNQYSIKSVLLDITPRSTAAAHGWRRCCFTQADFSF